MPKMNVSSMRRNPVIADIFGRLNYMDRRGSGSKKRLSNYQFQPQYKDKMAPSFNSDNNRFILRMDNLNYDDAILDRQSGAQGGAQGDAQGDAQGNDRLPIDKQIIECILDNKKITQQEIADTLGVSRRTVQRQMKTMNNIKYVGRGYSGHWVVRKH